LRLFFGARELGGSAGFVGGEADARDASAHQRHPSSGVRSQVYLWRMRLVLARRFLHRCLPNPDEPESNRIYRIDRMDF